MILVGLTRAVTNTNKTCSNWLYSFNLAEISSGFKQQKNIPRKNVDRMIFDTYE